MGFVARISDAVFARTDKIGNLKTSARERNAPSFKTEPHGENAIPTSCNQHVMIGIDTFSTTSADAALPRLLTEIEAAAYIRMSPKWLQKKRLSGGGIPFIKYGAAIRYRLSDIEEFERRNLRLSTSDRGER